MGGPKPEVIGILKEFKKKAKEKFSIDKLILFGSLARGSEEPGSDIDLMVVSRMFGGKAMLKTVEDLYDEWHLNQQIDWPVDFLCYTPAEFDRLRKLVTIVKQAVEEGVEI